jgi:hypothetical protein
VRARHRTAGQSLQATLLPENQIPPTESNGSGTALVTLNSGQGEVCWDISVSDLTTPVILAHIHQGDAQPTVRSSSTSTSRSTAQRLRAADPALIKDIRRHPADYYVNVHTTMFTGGKSAASSVSRRLLFVTALQSSTTSGFGSPSASHIR